MEQLIHAFGIDAKLIIIQIINFVVMMGALTYFLYTPVLNMLREREEKIKQGMADAEAAKAAKDAAEEEKQNILTGAHKEAEDVAARAKVFAEEKSRELIHEAEHKAGGIVEKAEAAGAELKNKAKKESEAEIAKLAVLAAEQVLRERT